MSITVNDQNIGHSTAYGYAKSKGYTGTEEEFAELMASYATVAEEAEASAEAASASASTASTKANEASASATSASQSASSASTSAQTATTKASEASASATSASGSASTASTKASEASASATSASESATTASTKASEASASAATATAKATEAAQSATDAETAQTAAETAAASVSASAAQIATNTSNISDLKEDLNAVASMYDSANLFDKSAITTNKSISTNGGIGVADINDLIDDDHLNVSPIIPIEVGKYVSNSATTTKSTKILAYDANGKYKGGINASVSDGVYTYNLIGNISFIRFQYLPSVLNIDEYMFVRGEALPDSYLPYGKILSGGVLYDSVNELHDEIAEAVDSIDTEINNVNTDIDTIDTTINDLLETGIEFTENGFINFNGVLVDNANYKSTDFVNCVVGGTFIPYKYRLQMFANTKIAYYNESKVFISAISPSESSTLEYVEGIVPYVEDANYIRFCTAKSAVDYYVKYASIKNIVVNGTTEANPCNYSGDDISVFNKILCIGDSLTSGTFNYRVGDTTGNYIEDAKYSYPTYLKKLTGCETTNMGNGGMSSAEWYNSHKNDDLSGYDCAIIQLGVNDRIRYTTWGETSETAFTNIINKLKTENKNIKIFVANIIPATSYSDAQYLAFSADLLAWVTSTYASDVNVIPLDMQQYGHTKDSPAYNCGHLSAYGYWRLAQDYKGYIGWYMNQNKTVFKEVQFIGTEYNYDPIS